MNRHQLILMKDWGDVPKPPLGNKDPRVWAGWMELTFSSQPRRWIHVRTVWTRVLDARQKIGSRTSPAKCIDLELAAILHDVGKAIDPTDTVPHSLVGALHLEAWGLPEVAPLVANHSGAKEEARLRGYGDVITRWSDVDELLLSILTYIDMTTSLDGTIIDPEARYLDIKNRFGPLSYQIKAFDSIWEQIFVGQTFMLDR